MTIAERAQQLILARTPFVQATVVRAQQPTSVRPGDQAILLADGTIEGFVGGECAQHSVRKAALGALQTNESVLLRVLPDGDVHFPEAPGACVVVNPCLSGGALEIFLAPQIPAPAIQICGASPISDKLAELATALGFEVLRDGADSLEPVTAVVIASHGGPEAEMIRSSLDAGVGYIGLVASKVRGAAILDGLELTDAEQARVHTPVGLPIGAKTPAEIAVSILAEVVRENPGGRSRGRGDMTVRWVTGVVLAAGASSRLGTPKQLLPFGHTTLLGASVAAARACSFDQLIVTLGAAASAVRAGVPLDGVEVVTVDDSGSGCSSSLRGALPRVDPLADGIVLLLGDQPGVAPATVERLIAAGTDNPIVVCRYNDGIGHPFWLSRTTFGEISQLHGDKGVWKLVEKSRESGRFQVRDLPVDGAVPLDVDTWDDYHRLLAVVSR